MQAVFDAVVLAGGGHRCWWQLGWWDVVAPALGLAPIEMAGVSAGAATACLIYASSSAAALDYYERRLVKGSRNFYPGNVLRAGARALPHESIYREALATFFDDEGFDRLQRSAPRIRVMIARPPAGWHPVVAVGAGLLAYNIEKYCYRPLHPTFGLRLGFTPEVFEVADCATAQALIDLIIASSSTPPFTAIQRVAGGPTLDGGLIDNVPVSALSPMTVDAPRSTLVLVTRHYPARAPVFEHEGRVYVQPSRAVAVSSWDYTSPSRYRATYQQGRIDARVFLDWIKTRPGL